MQDKTAGLRLGDGTEIISAAGLVDGRDVSVDGSKLDGIEAGADVTDQVRAFVNRQSATRTTLAIVGSAVAWAVATAKQHMELDLADEGGTVTFSNPTDALVPDTPYFLFVTCDNSTELAWGDKFDWGTAGEYDFSAEANNKVVVVSLVVYSASKIYASAVGGFGG